MIARVAVSETGNLFLSAKLGLVSVPVAGKLPLIQAGMEAEGRAPSGRMPDFDRGAAAELLRGLGENLGLSLLVPKEESFPDADSDVGPGPAFPDDAVRKTLESLDVVWIKEGEVVAAFAFEADAGRWEGIRRLGDLLALHPKLKAALYLVSVPALKAGLISEINRPLYRLLKRTLGETVRILDWNCLEAEVRELGERVRYLKPEFLDGISEVVEPPAAG